MLVEARLMKMKDEDEGGKKRMMMKLKAGVSADR